jgi:hypothetical protein
MSKKKWSVKTRDHGGNGSLTKDKRLMPDNFILEGAFGASAVIVLFTFISALLPFTSALAMSKSIFPNEAVFSPADITTKPSLSILIDKLGLEVYKSEIY